MQNRIANLVRKRSFVWVAAVASVVIFLPAIAHSDDQPVTVTISANAQSAPLAPTFLGLSYESSALIPQNGHFYFDSNDKALVTTFRTLGIKSLRVGANAVDDARIPIPDEKDIDSLFTFARAAGVKVIYSFRLKNGDPANSARLATYIAAHDADALDSFSIGNEPNLYKDIKTFDVFFARWKPHYDAILQAVPTAMFDGPSTGGRNDFAVPLAKAIFAQGPLAMASDHSYFLGSGREGEKDPAATRAKFLSDKLHGSYAHAYSKVGAVLAAMGVPYRMDELNSCYNGGAKDSSDTYASTLWCLDCTHWWAAHHLIGMNYHTGEAVGRDGGFFAPNYSSFTHLPGGVGFYLHPEAYALLAFTQGAHGRAMDVKTQAAPNFNFDAYAYQDGPTTYVTLINKSYAEQGRTATVSLQLPKMLNGGVWQQMDLIEKDGDIAAKTGVTLGGSAIDPQGNWSGQWRKIEGGSDTLAVQVPPASATLLRCDENR
jgi:hypothetical protein